MLTSLKRTFNIAGCNITIQPNQSEYHQGDPSSCELFITGGEYEQAADEITISLEESWTEGSGDNQRTVRRNRDKKSLSGNIILRPGETHKYEFSTQLPPNCRLSSGSGSLGWCLFVNVDVPGALDPNERLNLRVINHREFIAIWDSCVSDLRFTEGTFSFYGKRFIPPQPLQGELDCMDVALSQLSPLSGSTTHCTLTFDLQEKSMGDYFKMLTNKDKVKRELDFSNEEIFDSEGKPKSQEIAQKIAAVMQEVVEANK